MKRAIRCVAITLVFGLISLACHNDPELSPKDPFVPHDVVAHYTFEQSVDDVAGTFDPLPEDVIDISYVESHNDSAGTAASFNGTTSLAEISNADQFLSHNDFSIAFWINTSTDKKGHFVMGLAGPRGFHFEIDSSEWSSTTKYVKLTASYNGVDSVAREDQLWNGNGKTKDNGGWQGVNVNKEVSGGIGSYFANTWAHVVCVYNSADKVNTLYINGEKVKDFDFDQWPDWDVRRKVTGVIYDGNPAPGNKLALGFIQARENRIMKQPWAAYTDQFSNHFKGLLDDLWIFSSALSDIEAAQLYNSEK
jgi:hypothetical protein